MARPLKLKIFVKAVNDKKLRRQFQLAIAELRVRVRDEVIPELRKFLDKGLRNALEPLAKRLAGNKFKQLSIGVFGIPRSGGPEIHPKNFARLFIDKAITKEVLRSTGGRLDWFDLDVAYAKTQYIWTGRSGRNVSWLKILEEGIGPITGYTFIPGTNFPKSRSGFGVMRRTGKQAKSTIKARGGRGGGLVPIENWESQAFKRIAKVLTETKTIETFISRKMEELITKGLGKAIKLKVTVG